MYEKLAFLATYLTTASTLLRCILGTLSIDGLHAFPSILGSSAKFSPTHQDYQSRLMFRPRGLHPSSLDGFARNSCNNSAKNIILK